MGWAARHVLPQGKAMPQSRKPRVTAVAQDIGSQQHPPCLTRQGSTKRRVPGKQAVSGHQCQARDRWTMHTGSVPTGHTSTYTLSQVK